MTYNYNQKLHEARSICLDADDGESVDRWVENLRREKAVLAYKNCATPPPSGSGISDNAFVLILQTEWQRARAQDFGNSMLHIDGTHNVTCYHNLNLYTILGRDKQGKGVFLQSVGYILSSYESNRNPTCLVPFVRRDRAFALLLLASI